MSPVTPATEAAIATLQRELTDHRVRLGWTVVDTSVEQADLPDGLTIPEKPDAAFLSKVLRNPTMWPEGFVWDFSKCPTCGLGMASRLWLEMEDVHPWTIGRAFGLDINNTCNVFGAGLLMTLGKNNCRITPTDVADALDRAIAAQVAS